MTDDYALGIELPEVYDGVSIWVTKDGEYVNRWAKWGDDETGLFKRRYERTEEAIARYREEGVQWIA